MQKSVLQLSLMFVVLVLAQAVIFNHVVLYSVGLAFVFIYFIIKLPVNFSASKVILLSFHLGLAMDIFQDTPGAAALACTCLGACRKTILRLYIPREDDIIHTTPSIRTLGTAVFSKYVLTMALVYSTLIFLIEAFTFFNPGLTATRIVASTLLTSLLLIATDSLSRSSSTSVRSEKRL